MTDTSIAHPILSLAAAGIFQVAFKALKEYDDKTSSIEQAIHIPHPILAPLAKIPVIMPVLVEAGGTKTPMAFITLSDATEAFEVDVNVPAKPIAVMALIPTVEGEAGIAFGPYDAPEGEPYELDELEAMLLEIMQEMHQGGVARRPLTIDPTYQASAKVALDEHDVAFAA